MTRADLPLVLGLGACGDGRAGPAQGGRGGRERERRSVAAARVEEPLHATPVGARVFAAAGLVVVALVMAEPFDALDRGVYDTLDELAEAGRAGQNDQHGKPSEEGGESLHREWRYHGGLAVASSPSSE